MFFFFTDPAPTEIYTLSLHDALPISSRHGRTSWTAGRSRTRIPRRGSARRGRDRKSTRLNSSHGSISYAVFCLKKKKKEMKAKRNSSRTKHAVYSAGLLSVYLHGVNK